MLTQTAEACPSWQLSNKACGCYTEQAHAPALHATRAAAACLERRRDGGGQESISIVVGGLLLTQ